MMTITYTCDVCLRIETMQPEFAPLDLDDMGWTRFHGVWLCGDCGGLALDLLRAAHRRGILVTEALGL